MKILNTMTGEYISLPPLEKGRRLFIRLCGFGFCPKTNQFKVLRVSFNVSSFWFGSRCVHTWHWHLEKHWGVPSFNGFFWDSLSVFVNGSLHYYCSAWREYDQICAFDFEKEKFKTISLPTTHYSGGACDHDGDDDDDDDKEEEEEDNDHDESYFLGMNIGIYGNSLSYSCFTDISWTFLEVWLMREYGVAESWTKMFVIENNFNFYNPSSIKGIKLFENGRILLYNVGEGEGDLVWYNPESKNHTMLDTHGIK